MAEAGRRTSIVFRLRFHDNLGTKDIGDIMYCSRKTAQIQFTSAAETSRINLAHFLTIPIIILPSLPIS
ncbi:MAG: hypothetical protein ABI415_02645 [Flavitalea sp.]